MARFIIRVSDELHDEFQKYCERQNKTVSEVVRDFVSTLVKSTVSTPVLTNSRVSTSSQLSVSTSSQVDNPGVSTFKKVIFDPLTGEPLQ